MIGARGGLFALAVLVTARAASASGPAAPARVWVVDDGEKIKQDEVTSPLAAGTDNPIWSPGQPIRLFALKNETIAFQVLVSAASDALEGVTVELDSLEAESGARIQNTPGATDPTRYVGRPIERFVEHYLTITRASGGKHAGESLGWATGAGPRPDRWTGRVPDALVPIEIAPAWSPYPMRIAPHTNGAVWIDVTVPKTTATGRYTGVVVVEAGGARLARLPVELDVEDATLPDVPVRTMVYYDRATLDRRIGAGDAAERHLWQLLHRHRLSPLHAALDTSDVEHHMPALDGSAYTRAAGYEGPGEGVGDDVLAFGVYGSLGAPDAAKLAQVEAMADLLAQSSRLASVDAFVYAIDESCSSPYGARWRELLSRSTNPNARRVRVAWTCSEDATQQPVDIPIQLATFDPSRTARARALGKEVWVYNGQQPHTATFLTDSPAIAPRINGWLEGMFDIGRWFYWESTLWYDAQRGPGVPYDPFVTAETFHNAEGDFCAGDGVLVYPGKQVDMFTTHSLGMCGVVASIRLKNWRRGVEDAAYYQLARAVSAVRAEAIGRKLLPRVLSAAKDGEPPSWSDAGKPYFDARRALLALIVHRAASAEAEPALVQNERATGDQFALAAVALATALATALLWRKRQS